MNRHGNEMPGSTSRRATGLIVLGMHRSGTSALAGALSVLGANLGRRLLEPAQDNRLGYFEHAQAVSINERLLAGLGLDWADWRAMPEDWLTHPLAQRMRRVVRRLLAREFGAGGLWALKDPRLCRTFPLWREAAHDVGLDDLRVILAFRHPTEVAASLHKRDRLPASLGVLLWLRHLHEALQASQGLPLCGFDFRQLVADPVAALADVGQRLELQWPAAPETVADRLGAFVRGDQVHHAEPHLDDCDPELLAQSVALFARLRDGADLAALADEAAAACAGTEGRLRRQGWGEPLEYLQRGVSCGAETALRLRRTALRQIADLDARIGECQAALARTETLSLERLAQLQALDAQLGETQAALARTEALSLERLEQIAALDRQVGEERAHAQRIAAERDALARREVALTQRVTELEAELAAIHASTMWRVWGVVRLLRRWLVQWRILR
ncbi:MAG: hypothetical protein ACK5AZ_25310 [Bryobacteraceae bacterium]